MTKALKNGFGIDEKNYFFITAEKYNVTQQYMEMKGEYSEPIAVMNNLLKEAQDEFLIKKNISKFVYLKDNSEEYKKDFFKNLIEMCD